VIDGDKKRHAKVRRRTVFAEQFLMQVLIKKLMRLGQGSLSRPGVLAPKKLMNTTR
jgi:hypothetical protein